ncbi:hypothetical protein LA080_007368 [Diaporthe eres]|nr:hypothetical protein LA080_007368 [Diaporthe eres]
MEATIGLLMEVKMKRFVVLTTAQAKGGRHLSNPMLFPRLIHAFIDFPVAMMPTRDRRELQLGTISSSRPPQARSAMQVVTSHKPLSPCFTGMDGLGAAATTLKGNRDSAGEELGREMPGQNKHTEKV